MPFLQMVRWRLKIFSCTASDVLPLLYRLKA